MNKARAHLLDPIQGHPHSLFVSVYLCLFYPRGTHLSTNCFVTDLIHGSASGAQVLAQYYASSSAALHSSMEATESLLTPPRSMLADKSFSVAPRKRPGGCCLGACFAQSDPDSQSQTPLFINQAIYAWWVYIRICCECIGSNPLDGAFFSRPDSWCTNLLRILPSSQEKGTTTRRRHYVMKRLGGRTTSPCTCGRQVLQAEKRASFECRVGPSN